jgi:transcriptional regulator with XRE-family HTH domain
LFIRTQNLSIGGDEKVCSDIRDSLRQVIFDRGFKQSAIAEKANISPSKLNQTLKKQRKLEANELFNLCNAVGMTPDELREYSTDSAEPTGRR